MSTIIVGPYTVPIQFPQITFNPEPSQISAISNAYNAVVTTVNAHGYSTGIIVQFMVNPIYGMEINNQTSTITVIDDFNFSTNINSLQLSTFIIPSQTQAFPAQVVPFSGINFTGVVYNTFEQLATPGNP